MAAFCVVHTPGLIFWNTGLPQAILLKAIFLNYRELYAAGGVYPPLTSAYAFDLD